MENRVVLTAANLAQINIQRRRPLQPHKQKKVVMKRLRAQGEAYPNRKNGAPFAKAAVPRPAAIQICRCKKTGCGLSVQVKQGLFEQFREHDNQIQSMILMNCILITEPKERSAPANPNLKESTYKYNVLVNGIRQPVCRRTLVDIFGITKGRLGHIVTEMKAGKLVPQDHRGMHETRPNRVPEVVRDQVRDHIRSYRTYESHYCRPRAPAGTRYLNPDLNVSIMFEDFLQGQRNNGRPECEQWLYYDIFNREFPKLRLCTPKTDTCDECDKYKAQLHDATVQERTEIQQKQLLHHSACENTYDTYKNDGIRAKADPNYIVITVDLQQVMFTPGLRNSNAFYLRKLSNFNLGIHRANDDNSTMHLWTEMVAGRGSNEIGSCLWNYVTSNYAVQGSAARTLVVWMDRCVGQNNNKIILSLLQRIVDSAYFGAAEQKFFQTGHSYNSCDRAFGTIESRMRQMQLELPNQIEDLVRSACSVNPFEPKRLGLSDFFDFKSRTKQFKPPASFKVTQFIWYTIRSGSPNILFARKTHDTQENWTLFYLNYNKAAHSLTPVPVVRAASIPIEASKLRDLEKFLPQLHSEAHAYYLTLVTEERNRQAATQQAMNHPQSDPDTDDEESQSD